MPMFDIDLLRKINSSTVSIVEVKVKATNIQIGRKYPVKFTFYTSDTDRYSVEIREDRAWVNHAGFDVKKGRWTPTMPSYYTSPGYERELQNKLMDKIGEHRSYGKISPYASK